MFDKKTEILIFFVFVFFSALVADADAQGGGDLAAVSETSKRGEVLSPLAAKTFYDVGYELYTAKDADFISAEQAIIFFNAAVALDSKAGYVLPDIINIAWKYPDENFSDAVKLAMNEYIDRSTDLEVASKAVGYLLERLDSREQRQELLSKLFYQFQQKNEMFASDISAQLGFLISETADAVDAQMYLVKAFTANKYNRLAFAKLAELADKGGQPLPDISYLQNLRFAVRANPLDFDSAVRFAQYTETLGLYEPAAAAYKYCIDLLKYLSGPNSVGPDIYRPWLLNCFNARQYSQCRQILIEIRDEGIFDVQAEAIASAAASQGGDKDSSDAILAAIKARSDKILAGKLKVSSAELEDFVWFYSFIADVNSDQALTWATKAYDAGPNSANAASLFAYALTMNNQTELAGSMLEKIGTATRTAELAKAIVLLQRQDVNSATDLLKKVVEIAPGSFEAQKAKAKLKELGAEYISAIDSAAIATVLQNDFGQAFFSQFVEPQKMVSVEFNMKGNAFSYGGEITGNLVIINKYTEPMVVCPDAMIKGNIRIDVKLAGDLTEQIPALIVKTVRPSYEIKPGNALFIPLRLDTGKVKFILDRHPQAQLNLEYTAHIDPQITANGQITNALAIKPAKVIITRHKLNLDTHYLQQRLDAIKKGHQGQKAKSAQLFAGLLAEQQKLRSGTAYRFIYAEPQLLSSALARCLSENDWILKVQTIAAMQRLKLDYRLTEAVSEELENPNWPVRLIAVFSLAQNEGEKFMPVLSWLAKNDPHPMVKELAAILSGNVETDLSATADSNNINLQIEQKAQQEPSSESGPN
jgi:tetratricopeptide (TPR) repeat protein